jgi:hypothetical protein
MSNPRSKNRSKGYLSNQTEFQEAAFDLGKVQKLDISYFLNVD